MLSLLSVCFVGACATCSSPEALLEKVDPFFGSGGSTAPVSEGMARGWNWEKAQTGNTHPGAVLPFGWVSACGYSGGYSSGYGRFRSSGCGLPFEVLKETRLFGFTHFHHNGCGWIYAFLNNILMTPYAEGAWSTNSSAVANERATPGYYSAELKDYGAAFELTTDRFAALHRYFFPRGNGRLRVDLTVQGYRRDIFGGRPTYKESVEDYSVSRKAVGLWCGRYVTLGRPRYFALSVPNAAGEPTVTNGVMTFAFATPRAESALAFSDVSIDEALARVSAAQKTGFAATHAQARATWAAMIGHIRADFDDEKDARRFYGALYQSLIKPVEYREGRYAEFSTTWDTYRAQLPLALAFASPNAQALARSLLATSEELGYFPNTYLINRRPGHNDMQATALGCYVLADACFRGLLAKDEYPRVKAFFEREFKDSDISKRSLTHVLDLAGAYAAAAFTAERFGDVETAKAWRAKTAIWRTAYDPTTGLLPKSQNFYEGDERNYSFRPHVGMNDRVALAGGVARFEEMLNDFFAVSADFSKWTPARDRLRRPGHFEGLNNEADMDTPFAWFWAGRADRVCEVHDLIRRCRFSDGEGALPGNNDAGGTSAWYVWSCLGFSPIAGTPYYYFISPTVKCATVTFSTGATLKIDVTRPSARAIYPTEISFNGTRLSAPWIDIATLEKGGSLSFRMSETPQPRSPIPTGL